MAEIQRLYEIACGALVLVLTGGLAIMWVIVKAYEKQANINADKRIKAHESQMRKAMVKKGADHFVKMYEANKRIKELEKELATERNRNKIMSQAVEGFRIKEVR